MNRFAVPMDFCLVIAGSGLVKSVPWELAWNVERGTGRRGALASRRTEDIPGPVGLVLCLLLDVDVAVSLSSEKRSSATRATIASAEKAKPVNHGVSESYIPLSQERRLLTWSNGDARARFGEFLQPMLDMCIKRHFGT